MSNVKVALIIALLAYVTFLPPYALAPAYPSLTPQYTYIFDVDEDGRANVTIDFKSPSPGTSWFFVPNATRWELKVIKGKIISKEIKYTKWVFYNNFTFSYIPSGGSFELKVSYFFRYASIIVTDTAMFVSPQIAFDKRSRALVLLKLPLTAIVSLDKRHCLPFVPSVSRELRKIVLRYEVSGRKLNVFRIYLLYHVPWTPLLDYVREVKVGGKVARITVKAPARYKSIAERILRAYQGAFPILANITHTTLSYVTVRFFPPTFKNLWTGGYVEPFTGGRTKVINLNPFFIRTRNGSLEQIAIHELVHQFLLAAGIYPQKILWFHEGSAEYFSITIAEKLGYVGAYYRERELKDAIKEVLIKERKRPGFIQEWGGEVGRPITHYYAVAYYVLKYLADHYGGLRYYSRFYSLIREKRVIISDQNSLVYFLSKAAGKDLYPLFKEWGFKVSRVLSAFPSIPPPKAPLA
ncbi:MAG: hypothetical protein B6U69_04255 [Thermofilum sp. ex4484_15]|nr:MAG: hypothetical protein B6U69_04255 [Thermofilum sp. ex4484_15]